jgi:hypothetical protein
MAKEKEIQVNETVHDDKVIIMTATMSDTKGYLIPRGVNAKLKATIADEVAVFFFSDRNITDRFARIVIALERNQGKDNTIYHAHMHKIATKYPQKTKEEIRDHLLKQFQELNLKGMQV